MSKQIKKDEIVFLYSSNVRKLLANVAYKILGKKPRKLIAVTGTNGKSSISDFFFQILNLNLLHFTISFYSIYYTLRRVKNEHISGTKT